MQDGAGDICLQVRFLTNLLWLIFETFWSLCRCDRAERLLALLQEKVRSGTYAGGSGANAGGGASTRDRTASTDAPPGEEANHHQHSTDSLTRQISSEPGAPAPPSRVPPVGHPAAAAASGLAPGQGNVPDYANVNCNGGGPVTLEASDGYLVGHLTALKIQCWRTRWRTFFLSADPVASAASVVVTAAAAAIAAFVVDVVAAAATADVAATATVLFSYSFSIARFRKIVFFSRSPTPQSALTSPPAWLRRSPSPPPPGSTRTWPPRPQTVATHPPPPPRGKGRRNPSCSTVLTTIRRHHRGFRQWRRRSRSLRTSANWCWRPRRRRRWQSLPRQLPSQRRQQMPQPTTLRSRRR